MTSYEATAAETVLPPIASPDDLELVQRLGTHTEDTRTGPPDVFHDATLTDWKRLSWTDVGRPYLVDRPSRHRTDWEAAHARPMPIPVQWEHFNRSFHALFATDVPRRQGSLRRDVWTRLKGLDLPAVRRTLKELFQVTVWNHVQRVEDAVWDPRGKRALFAGLDVKRPRILFLGAADGYEAMQLQAMYPGGESVMVDYDDFCRTERWGEFPRSYPFLGQSAETGSWRVFRYDDLQMDFVVSDIRDLPFGPEFDIVLSVGLVEHFPDEHKPMALDWHRKFLKPGGYAILTTPRRQWRSKAFYYAMAEIMNYGYRELMDELQLGLYAWENGFDIRRCGRIKAHNGVVARIR